MKQVLLADKSNHLSNRIRPNPPILMWMGDDVLPGDCFQWKGHTYVVSAIYSTRLSACGTECKRTEFPKQHRATGVILDQRGGESTGVPGAGSGSGSQSH